MAIVKSDQRTNETATPRVLNPAYNHMGRVRVAEWTYTTPATGMPVVGDYIELVRLPVGAVILGGKIQNEANAAATLDIGYDTADTRYGSAVSIGSAGEQSFGNTIALNAHDKLTAEKVLRAKVGGATLTASKKIHGYVLYAFD